MFSFSTKYSVCGSQPWMHNKILGEFLAGPNLRNFSLIGLGLDLGIGIF